MTRTAEVVFDGLVLRPETPLELERNKRYTVTISEVQELPEGDAWDLLASLAGTVDAPPDWAQEHDHYIHGTAMRKP